jgi:riboflavin kinase/FMN adenylyltransferase
MKYVYSKVHDLNISQPLAVSIGNFDGLHIGHQKLLQNLIAIAKNKNFLSCLVSFNPHPISYFKKDKNFLIDLEQTKIELLEKIGLDFYVSIIFDKTIANLTSNEFEDIVLSKGLNTKLILSGLDFKYGSCRSGNITTLKNFSDKQNIDFNTAEVVLDKKLSNKISSSTIRGMIREGNVKSATQMLGREFEVRGTIIQGDQRGRTIGIPTANIKYNDLQVELKKGVYAVTVTYNNKKYRAIANYGIRPTFNKSTPLLEVHILDFNHDIYNHEITVSFNQMIREEFKFDGIEQLLKQIKTDISMARKILNYGN